MTNHTQDQTLVLNGTGKTGRRIVERLRSQGVPLRVGSRSGRPPFDWEQPQTWTTALDGVSSAYVSFFPDLAVQGAADAVDAFVDQAVHSGVRRLVLLSGRGEEEAQRSERAVQAAGVDWTVVRASWFNQNFSEGYMLDPVLAGAVALPVDGVPEPFVDADDIADVAVAALTREGHAGRVYEVTGPRLLTFADAVEEIARATGRDLRFASVPTDAYAQTLTEHGVPDDVVGLLRYLFIEVLDGRNASLADGVEQALGRPPRDFGDYARTTAATGVWAG